MNIKLDASDPYVCELTLNLTQDELDFLCNMFGHVGGDVPKYRKVTTDLYETLRTLRRKEYSPFDGCVWLNKNLK